MAAHCLPPSETKRLFLLVNAQWTDRHVRMTVRNIRHALMGGAAIFCMAGIAVPVTAQTAPQAEPAQPSSTPPTTAPDQVNIVEVTLPTFSDLTTLDPEAPLDPMPDVPVTWPDMAQPMAALPPSLSDEALAAAANRGNIPGLPPIELAQPGTGNGTTPGAPPPVDMAQTDAEKDRDALFSDAATERRYGVKVEGPEPAVNDAFKARFAGLSELDAKDGDEANIAQINRRARNDHETLMQMLRTDGYYGGKVDVAIERPQGSNKIAVTYTVTPGERFAYDEVKVRGLETTGQDEPRFREAFGVNVGDPVDADELKLAQNSLLTDMQENGYPFGKVGEESVVVDHAKQAGQLDQPVEPGGKRNFGNIVSSGTKPFGADHMQTIARFDQGEVYKASMVEDLRRALIATGLASSVQIKPVESASPDQVDIEVAMTPAPPRTISGQLGYGTGEGFRAEIGWEHRNMFPPEGAVLVRVVGGTREQLGSLRFRRNNFGQRDRVFSVEALASHLDRDAYDARTVSLSASLERQSNLIFQKEWTWSLGAELIATDERSYVEAIGGDLRRTYFIGAIPMSLYYDSTDDWLDPTSGFRLGGRVSPELSFKGGTFPYVRAQIDGSYYYPVGENIVLAGRARYGTIVGSGDNELAPSRRYYAGGGGSVRGYGYQSIGARDIDGKPLGGKGLAELSIEARIRLRGIMGGNLGIVPFFDAGNVYTNAYPDLSGFQMGAGVGLRYYSMFGPIRIDLATPINRRQGDPWVAVYVSLGQAF